MVNFNHSYNGDKKYITVDYAFYISSILLAAVVFGYFIFNFEVQLKNQKIETINSKSLNLSAGEGQTLNKKLLAYKNKIDDFAVILENHKITSNVLDFMEKNTLSNIWFSSFNMKGEVYEINLSGESANMEALSQQVKVFEENLDYVKDISVLDSQSNSSGKINFTISLSLDPEIFNYTEFFLEEPVSVHEGKL